MVQVVFRDPRRFGGLWTFESMAQLRAARWNALGPDALGIESEAIAVRLAGTRRAIKAALLDQSVIAGLGNIYVDESLFRAAIHPLTPARGVSRDRIDRLIGAINDVLAGAIESGGSTLRDYVDATGRAGSFRFKHLVYGRGGEACTRCDQPLIESTIGQRTTVHCDGCQPRRQAGSRLSTNLSTKHAHRLGESAPAGGAKSVSRRRRELSSAL